MQINSQISKRVKTQSIRKLGNITEISKHAGAQACAQ